LLYTGDNQMRADGTLCALIAMAFQIPTQCRGRYADWSPEEKKTLPVIVVYHVDEKPIELIRPRIN